MKYKTGSKFDVIYELVRCAIQDRRALCEAHESITYKSNFDLETIRDSQLQINDFIRVGITLGVDFSHEKENPELLEADDE